MRLDFKLEILKSGKTTNLPGTEQIYFPPSILSAICYEYSRKESRYDAHDQSKSHNYWDTVYCHGGNSLNDIGQEKFSVYLFYSDRLLNQPVGIRMTGNSF